MSFVTDTWRQLVRRRLWPVALLLLAALAAVPFLLAKDPEPAVVPAAPASAAGKTTLAEDSSDPIVSAAAAAGPEGSARRRVLGSSKDPFEPAPAKKVKVKAAQAEGTATPDATEAPSSSSDDSSASGGGASSPSTGSESVPVGPVAPTPAAKKKTYPLYSLVVRFGDSSSAPTRSRVNRLEALPDEDNPLLVYLGVKDGGKAAVFMLDSSVTPQGDGECEPSPANCETLVLREGETEFFDVAGADENSEGSQFQLDLVDINTKHSTTRETKGLKSVKVGGSLRYRYNARKGTLRKLGLHTRHTRSANAESAVVGN